MRLLTVVTVVLTAVVALSGLPATATAGNTFAPQQVITGLSDPYSLSAEDLNGDGLDDIAVSNQANHEFVRYLSLPGGGFGLPQSYWVATVYTVGIVCADLNGDHIPDAAVTSVDGCVTVFPGLGTGNFGTRKTYSVGDAPYGILALDINVDGRMDLVTVNHTGNNVSVLSQLGNGSFSRRDYAVGSAPWDLAGADFNHDGRPDLVVTNESSSFLTIFYGQSDGSLGAQLNLNMGSNGFLGVAASDFNGDGLVDIATCNEFTTLLDVRYGLPGGVFGNGKTFATGGMSSEHLEMADFNGDGLMDLALTASSEYSTKIGVLYGLPGGDFSAVDTYDVGRFPRELVSGDFNGDGRADLAVSNNRTDTISVLYNITPEPASMFLLALGGMVLVRQRRR
jgi:hypothetical protein